MISEIFKLPIKNFMIDDVIGYLTPLHKILK